MYKSFFLNASIYKYYLCVLIQRVYAQNRRIFSYLFIVVLSKNAPIWSLTKYKQKTSMGQRCGAAPDISTEELWNNLLNYIFLPVCIYRSPLLSWNRFPNLGVNKQILPPALLNENNFFKLSSQCKVRTDAHSHHVQTC